MARKQRTTENDMEQWWSYRDGVPWALCPTAEAARRHRDHFREHEPGHRYEYGRAGYVLGTTQHLPYEP